MKSCWGNWWRGSCSRQVGEEEQHSHSAGQQSGGVPGQLLQAGLSPTPGFRRLPDVHQHGDGHDRQQQRGGEVDELGRIRGIEPGGQPVQGA